LKEINVEIFEVVSNCLEFQIEIQEIFSNCSGLQLEIQEIFSKCSGQSESETLLERSHFYLRNEYQDKGGETKSAESPF